MSLKKGDRVRHPTKTDWGIGQVLDAPRGHSVRVFFVGSGEKTLSLEHVELELVAPEEASSEVLDNLSVPSDGSGIRYRSIPESIDRFLELFPEGFYGESYAKEERDYKVRAHELAQEILSEKKLDALLEQEDYSAVCSCALKVVNATNLIFPNEKMALKDGLTNPDAQKAFGIAIFDLLYGATSLRERFEKFSNVLEEIDAAKWTTATYFPFIVHPDQYIFLKPTVTQNAAEICHREINYTPKLNWKTYDSVLKFAAYLKSETAVLKPRDMIDVQSFMWCIRPGTY
jgi:hypothetical protein